MVERIEMALNLRRAFAVEAKKMNALLHDPDIEPMALLGHTETGGCDLLDLMSDERNVFLACEDSEGILRGAVIFHWMEPGVYEVHTMAQHVVRGKAYVKAVREAIRIMFTMSDAIELYTRVPRANKAALGLVRLVYGELQFECADAHPMYVLRFSDWLWGPLGIFAIERGQWFHARLEEQFAAQSRPHAQHPENLDHDRMVGITCDMMLACMIEKAMILYNRWAKLSGYHQIAIVVPAPLVINIGDAILQIDFPKQDFILLESDPKELANAVALDMGVTSRVAH